MKKVHKPLFFVVEGRSEESFIKFLSYLGREKNIRYSYRVQRADGGGYLSILFLAKKLKTKHGYPGLSFLVVDSDRGSKENISIEDFITKAKLESFFVLLQIPNFEGLLIKLLSKDRKNLPLKKLWSNYQDIKPADALALSKKIKMTDLERAALEDEQLRIFLQHVGLIES